jgi:hypothetical protein
MAVKQEQSADFDTEQAVDCAYALMDTYELYPNQFRLFMRGAIEDYIRLVDGGSHTPDRVIDAAIEAAIVKNGEVVKANQDDVYGTPPSDFDEDLDTDLDDDEELP